jgi:FixJ family two-component response regulator
MGLSISRSIIESHHGRLWATPNDGWTIPIVFITAHADEDIRPRVLEAGAVDCLFKPFSETALVGAVTTALRAS